MESSGKCFFNFLIEKVKRFEPKYLFSEKKKKISSRT